MFKFWIDITKTINLLQNKFQLGEYIGCNWNNEFWDINNGYKEHTIPPVHDNITIYVSHFIKYIDLKKEYIKQGKSVDLLIDYFHELLCLYVDDDTLNERITVRYSDNDGITFLREINKHYIK